MPELQVIIELLHPQAQAPSKAHESDACFDLRACQATFIAPASSALVSLGWAMQLEAGWEATIRGRSGLASRGIVAHHGTIDHLYRQEVKVIIHNLSGDEFAVECGDRVAQMSFAPVYPVTLTQGQVQVTQRGGFGSTGMK